MKGACLHLLLIISQLFLSSSFDNLPVGASLFAIVGGEECAEALPYGTFALSEAGSADGEEFYFSISEKSVEHDQWLQIVTADGDELYRTYWTFENSKTLQERIVDAVAFGEEGVNFEIVEENSGESTFLIGDWRFSRRAKINDELFDRFGDRERTRCCFSDGHGAWGAASSTVDGADRNIPDDFWGQGNFDVRRTDDEEREERCTSVYQNGRIVASDDTKSFFYLFSSEDQKSLEPTLMPTYNPSQLELVAQIGGSASCQTRYGVNEADASNSRSSFLSLKNNYLHSEWVQDVKLRTSGELQFRIIWQFAEQKSLVDRLEDAVAVGEEVQYTVLDGDAADSTVLGTYEGVWRYASGAFEPGTLRKALEDEVGSACCLNVDGAAWGAGSGEVDGSEDPPGDFWGIGDFGSCFKLYRDGAEVDADAVNVVVNDHSKLRRILQTSDTITTVYMSDAEQDDDDDDDANSNSNGGSDSSDSSIELILIVVGILVGIIILTAIVFMIMYCRRRKRDENSAAVETQANFATPADYTAALTPVILGADSREERSEIKRMKASAANPSAPPIRPESMDGIELEALSAPAARNGPAIAIAAPVDTSPSAPPQSENTVTVAVATPYR